MEFACHSIPEEPVRLCPTRRAPVAMPVTSEEIDELVTIPPGVSDTQVLPPSCVDTMNESPNAYPTTLLSLQRRTACAAATQTPRAARPLASGITEASLKLTAESSGDV